VASRSYDFYFTRLMYDSGDWDVDIRMPSNVLNSLIEYTTLKVDPAERVVALSDPKMLEAPFCYLAGHKLVQFSPVERKNFERYVRGGGFVFVDDCNHDIDGLFAKSFEAELARMFGPRALRLFELFQVRGPAQYGQRAQWVGGRPGARLPEGD